MNKDDCESTIAEYATLDPKDEIGYHGRTGYIQFQTQPGVYLVYFPDINDYSEISGDELREQGNDDL